MVSSGFVSLWVIIFAEEQLSRERGYFCIECPYINAEHNSVLAELLLDDMECSFANMLLVRN
jgi:hypothetical protein